MSPVPDPHTNPKEPTLTHDEWRDLFDHLRLSQQADYAAYGGPVAFIRAERDCEADEGA